MDVDPEDLRGPHLDEVGHVAAPLLPEPAADPIALQRLEALEEQERLQIAVAGRVAVVDREDVRPRGDPELGVVLRRPRRRSRAGSARSSPATRASARCDSSARARGWCGAGCPRAPGSPSAARPAPPAPPRAGSSTRPDRGSRCCACVCAMDVSSDGPPRCTEACPAPAENQGGLGSPLSRRRFAHSRGARRRQLHQVDREANGAGREAARPRPVKQQARVGIVRHRRPAEPDQIRALRQARGPIRSGCPIRSRRSATPASPGPLIAAMTRPVTPKTCACAGMADGRRVARARPSPRGRTRSPARAPPPRPATPTSASAIQPVPSNS